MSKHTKTLEKLTSIPPSPNIKWTELKNCLEHLGYKMLKNDGSRRKFYHKEKDALIICHEPHPSPDVDKGCIKNIIEHLTLYGFIKR
jgi:predicted RNA binding protein YcfA (HicA-like mRNA interferase family)